MPFIEYVCPGIVERAERFCNVHFMFGCVSKMWIAKDEIFLTGFFWLASVLFRFKGKRCDEKFVYFQFFLTF